MSTPAILQCGELMKEIEHAKNQHDAQEGTRPSRKQAAEEAALSSTPVKHTRRRSLASTPPPTSDRSPMAKQLSSIAS